MKHKTTERQFKFIRFWAKEERGQWGLTAPPEDLGEFRLGWYCGLCCRTDSPLLNHGEFLAALVARMHVRSDVAIDLVAVRAPNIPSRIEGARFFQHLFRDSRWGSLFCCGRKRSATACCVPQVLQQRLRDREPAVARFPGTCVALSRVRFIPSRLFALQRVAVPGDSYHCRPDFCRHRLLYLRSRLNCCA